MITKSMIISTLIAFFITVLLSPTLIKFLQKLKFGQVIRDLGPEDHLKKKGTPTMGGIIFIFAIAVVSLIFIKDNPEILPILFVTVGFGLIGFLDDYIKVTVKVAPGKDPGLKPLHKMLGQIVITGVFAWYMIFNSGHGTSLLIPFTGGMELDLGILYVPVLFFVVLGTVNGANFTDGLDGLASSVTLLITVFLTVVAIGFGMTGILPITCATIGALLGFLVFNVYPARVFMGDTGSLALGGFVVSTAYVLRIPFLIPIFAFIYLAEVVSVILQVAYFKKTGGKRLFKMAPIHHHYEKSGWPETKVTTIFSIVTAVLCLVAYLAI